MYEDITEEIPVATEKRNTLETHLNTEYDENLTRFFVMYFTFGFSDALQFF